MSAVPEVHVLGGGVRELVLGVFPFPISHARESEWIERIRVVIVRIVMVRGMRCRRKNRAFRNERPIRQRDIFQDLPRKSNYAWHKRRISGRFAPTQGVSRVSLTERDAVVTLRLPQEAVELPHLSDGGFCPALYRNEGINFLSELAHVLGLRSEM